jgi:hypothetical protein
MNEEIQKTELTVKLNSEPSEASPTAVGSTLIAIDALVNEVSKAFDENQKFLLKARPFKEGSFEIEFSLAVITSIALTQLPVLRDFLSILKQYFEVKKLLKGEKPKLNEQNKIVIEGNEIKIDNAVLNIISSENIANQMISQAFTEIEKDTTIKDVQIFEKTPQNPLAKIERKEFHYYKIPEPDTMIIEKYPTEKILRTTLHIVSPVFDNKSKWKFILDGKRISAEIADEKFIDIVASGEAFACGDKLDVDLQVIQKYDDVSSCYIDSRYIIIKVRNHIKRKEYPKLF